MRDHTQSPIVIGATGGSGTRVFAKICMAAGYYMGKDLNDSLDAMAFVGFYDRWINPFLLRDRAPFSSAHSLSMQDQLRQCVLRHRSGLQDPGARWGWKGPRSMFLVDFFNRCFPAMKFIHVVRDGRDMAYSSNQNQLQKHGRAVIDGQWEKLQEPCRSMLLWNISNTAAARFGETVLGRRYLRVRFEDLCTDPQPTISLILEFLEVDSGDAPALADQVQAPASIGRWHSRPAHEVAELQELGCQGLMQFGYL